MRNDQVRMLLASRQLRERQADRERVKSIIKSAQTNADVVQKIQLTEESATVIFREVYESIRQLGNAQWWLDGYEPLNNEVSLEILKDMDIKEKVKLNHLVRFKKIRNDANYRGFSVSASQAKEIIDFWNTCGKDILGILMKNI